MHHSQGAARGIRTCVLRLPLHVYDKEGSGFTKVMEKKALERGHAVYFDEGVLAASSDLNMHFAWTHLQGQDLNKSRQ